MATTLLTWHQPTSWPATLPATPDVRNDRLCTAFDPSTGESCYLEAIMPQAYGAGTISLKAHCATDATSGDFDLDVSVEAASGLDLDGDSFDTVNSQDGSTMPGTAGTEFDISVTLTNKDSIAAGGLMRLKVARDIADTAAADLQIFAFELQEA